MPWFFAQSRFALSAVLQTGSRALTCLVLIFLVTACVTQSQSFYGTDRISELRQALTDSDLNRADILVERYNTVLSELVALDLAIQVGSVKAVRHFVTSSRVNRALDPDGVTPLIRAVQEAPANAREKIIRALLDAGADPEINDNFGRNAANYAAVAGDLTLAAFLESQGRSFYSSQPAQRTAWLPQIDIDRALDATRKRKLSKSERANPVLSKSPLQRSRTGRPDLLFATAWVPQVRRGQPGPFAGLRFHADGTGEVMQYFPRNARIENGKPSYLAWDYHRDDLYFMVLTESYASYCKSIAGGPGRFGVSCTDYSAAGGNIRAALGKSVSPDSVKALLDNSTSRAKLQEVGSTSSVLEPSGNKVCKPVRASASTRRGKPLSAASTRQTGEWVVFDARRFTSYSAEKELVCTQREARTAAFNICKAAGGNCRSVGGCRKGQATVVASVQGHDWAWVGCDANIEAAKQQALQQCRDKAGCDCQVVYAAASVPQGPNAVCKSRRRS
ncbi:MAG: ankyrin repeat domain-containing protein [Burkholderiaceae bacterium]